MPFYPLLAEKSSGFLSVRLHLVLRRQVQARLATARGRAATPGQMPPPRMPPLACGSEVGLGGKAAIWGVAVGAAATAKGVAVGAGGDVAVGTGVGVDRTGVEVGADCGGWPLRSIVVGKDAIWVARVHLRD